MSRMAHATWEKGMQKKGTWEARVVWKFSPSVQTQHFAVRKGWLGEIRLFSRNPLSSLTHGVAGVLAVLLVCLPESHQPAPGDASSDFPRAPTFLKGQGTFIFLLFSSFQIQKNFDWKVQFSASSTSVFIVFVNYGQLFYSHAKKLLLVIVKKDSEDNVSHLPETFLCFQERTHPSRLSILSLLLERWRTTKQSIKRQIFLWLSW